jgi:uncharacterized protein
MTTVFDGFNDIVRLNKGETLTQFLDWFRADHKDFPGAWVSGLGGVLEVTLGYYDLDKKDYVWKKCDGLREMTGLQGNLASNEAGELVLHAHGTFTDTQFVAIGGHVKDFVTAATVELFLHRTYKPLQRKHDETVGLPLLDI